MVFTAAELVGYVASLLLVISFIMKDVRKLRMINSLSCTLFIVYGFMLATAWPIIIANFFVLSANVWHLFLKRKA